MVDAWQGVRMNENSIFMEDWKTARDWRWQRLQRSHDSLLYKHSNYSESNFAFLNSRVMIQIELQSVVTIQNDVNIHVKCLVNMDICLA